MQGFHLVQSFAAGEVTPELAHRIGLEFAGQLLQGRYQAVVSTHLNTGHIHNHIVWNSVAIQDGKKYRSNARSYYTEVRAISDALCKQHGLSVIEANRSEPAGRPYPQWLAEQENRPTWKAAIQQDIDQVVNEVLTWNQFVRALEGKGYILRLNRKYITLQPPGKARPVRFKTLGKNYTPEAIRRRILYPERNSPAGNERPLPPALRTLLSERPARKVTGLQKLYVIYLFQVGVLPTKPVYMSYAVREDIRKLDQRIAQVEFILKNEIRDRGQLNEMRCAAEGKIDRLLKERRGLYRRDPDSPRVQEITARLKELRRTAKLCRDIEEHSLANVGIAMGGVGSDIAVDAADIVLVDDEIKELPHLLALSKKMMKTIKLNLAFSMGLNFLAIALAITGLLGPVIGALVHNAGSVVVIINSAMLLRWKQP